jgi:hypothetical protein
MAVVGGDHDQRATTGGVYLPALADHLALVFDEKEIAKRNGHRRNYLSDGSGEFFKNVHLYFHLHLYCSFHNRL